MKKKRNKQTGVGGRQGKACPAEEFEREEQDKEIRREKLGKNRGGEDKRKKGWKQERERENVFSSKKGEGED